MSSESLSLGEAIYITVKPIFKIYLIIGVGFWLARKNILTVETAKNISAIAIKVLIPCLTFQKIVTNINNLLIKEIATIIIIAYFMMFSQALLVFAGGVLVGCPRNWWGGLILCGLLPNISDLPIAYLQTMETANVFQDIDLGVSYVMIYMGLQLLLQFTMGSYKLIEYDFKVDLQTQLEGKGKKMDEESTNTSDLMSYKNVTSENRSNIATTNNSIDPPQIYAEEIVNNEILFSETNDNVETGSLELNSIDSQVYNNSNFGQQILHASSNLIKSVSNLSKVSKNPSRVVLPVNLLENEHAGQTPEDINDVIRVYSHYDEVVKEPYFSKIGANRIKKGKLSLYTIYNSIIKFNYKMIFWEMVDVWKDSFRQPASVVLVISVAVSMIPWVQALFVESTQVQLPSAPDKQPPLSFIMDFAGYIGAAQVPFGLLMLGGTIGRLKIGTFPRALLRVPLMITFLRLFLFPVIGCSFNSKINKDGLFYGQDILYFLSNINFCLPPATSLIYITAFYTPSDGKNHIQMDLLALVYIFHYIFLVVCLPFTATYTMKVSLRL